MDKGSRAGRAMAGPGGGKSLLSPRRPKPSQIATKVSLIPMATMLVTIKKGAPCTHPSWPPTRPSPKTVMGGLKAVAIAKPKIVPRRAQLETKAPAPPERVATARAKSLALVRAKISGVASTMGDGRRWPG